MTSSASAVSGGCTPSARVAEAMRASSSARNSSTGVHTLAGSDARDKRLRWLSAQRAFSSLRCASAAASGNGARPPRVFRRWAEPALVLAYSWFDQQLGQVAQDVQRIVPQLRNTPRRPKLERQSTIAGR